MTRTLPKTTQTDVKNDSAMNARSETDNNRNDIIFLRFDVADFESPIGQATLNLTWFRDTNVSHLGLLYYGLNADAEDEEFWTETDLTYDSAPGLIPDELTTIEEFEDGAADEELQDLDLSELTFLGRRDLTDFDNDANIEGTIVDFSSRELTDFLNADPDDLATILVLRDVHSSGTQMRFATKETLDLETIIGDDFEQYSPTLVLDAGALLPGDFDGNGLLDVVDINALTVASASGQNETEFDVNMDGVVDSSDVTVWVRELARTWAGDANLDGEFNSGDLVSVFVEGNFERDIDSNWSQGDWNGDRRFNSGDFVVAFGEGGFENGPRGASSVPEPRTALAMSAALLWLAASRIPRWKTQ